MKKRQGAHDTGSGRTSGPDAVQARIALLATSRAEAGDCPSPEQLAKFTDNACTPPEREQIMAHLASCSDCYREWLDISAQAATERQVVKRMPASWPRASLGVLFAMAACLLVAISARDRLGNLLTLHEVRTEFSEAQTHPGAANAGLANRLAAALTAPSRGSGSEPSGPEEAALRAGFLHGLRDLGCSFSGVPLSKRDGDLLGSSAWLLTAGDHGAYYILGRWAVLARAACLARDSSPVSGTPRSSPGVLDDILRALRESAQTKTRDRLLAILPGAEEGPGPGQMDTDCQEMDAIVSGIMEMTEK